MARTTVGIPSSWLGGVSADKLKGAIETRPGWPDGFLVVALGSTALGAIWLALMRSRILALEQRPAESWQATHVD